MSRFIQPRESYISLPIRRTDPVRGQQTSGTDDASGLDNLLKYVPIEILTPYIVLANFLKSQVSQENLVDYGIATVVCFALVPVYLWWRAQAKHEPWRFQAAVSAVAFLIWAYAVGGMPQYADLVSANSPHPTHWFHPQAAAMSLFLFSLLTLFVTPKAGRSNPTPSEAPGAAKTPATLPSGDRQVRVTFPAVPQEEPRTI